jgi:transposase
MVRSATHGDPTVALVYLYRLGFVVKRPKKRLLKADEAKRETFVTEYAALRAEADVTGAKHFFVDEAHFYADVDLHGKWVLKRTPALVDSTSRRYGEKASYYSAVCLETGEVEAMPLTGHSSAETAVSFVQQLRAHHAAPLVVFWDNAPAHGGAPLRDYLTTPDLHLRLVRLPAYSPDFNADEHIWAWVREEVTANTCFGTADKVRAHVDPFLAGLAAEPPRLLPRRVDLDGLPAQRPEEVRPILRGKSEGRARRGQLATDGAGAPLEEQRLRQVQ